MEGLLSMGPTPSSLCIKVDVNVVQLGEVLFNAVPYNEVRSSAAHYISVQSITIYFSAVECIIAFGFPGLLMGVSPQAGDPH